MRRVSTLLFPVLLGAVILGGCAHKKEYSVPTETALYHKAENSLKVANWKEATTRFRTLLSTYPFGKYATQGRLNLIYAYYRNGNTDEAASQADDFVKENPASPYAAYALFMKGVAYANGVQPGLLEKVFGAGLGDRDPDDQQQAFTAFKQLIQRYPNSRYAHQAKRWMIFVRSRLARFDLNVAHFYMRHKQWVAAASRAAKIIKEFPDTTSTKAAFQALIRSYKALGEKSLASDAQAWYDFNYGPNNGRQAAGTGETADNP